MDSLCRDLIEEKNDPEKIKSESKIIFGMAWCGAEERMEDIVVEHLMHRFAIYNNGRERKGKYKRIIRSENLAD
jgi:hypothetical protein